MDKHSSFLLSPVCPPDEIFLCCTCFIAAACWPAISDQRRPLLPSWICCAAALLGWSEKGDFFFFSFCSFVFVDVWPNQRVWTDWRRLLVFESIIPQLDSVRIYLGSPNISGVNCITFISVPCYGSALILFSLMRLSPLGCIRLINFSLILTSFSSLYFLSFSSSVLSSLSGTSVTCSSFLMLRLHLAPPLSPVATYWTPSGLLRTLRWFLMKNPELAPPRGGRIEAGQKRRWGVEPRTTFQGLEPHYSSDFERWPQDSNWRMDLGNDLGCQPDQW